MRTYKEILTDIKKLLNKKRNKETAQDFKKCLYELVKNYKIVLSTKFLRNLISTDKNNRQKTQRVKYLITKAGLKRKRENRKRLVPKRTAGNNQAVFFRRNQFPCCNFHRRRGIRFAGNKHGYFLRACSFCNQDNPKKRKNIKVDERLINNSHNKKNKRRSTSLCIYCKRKKNA